MVVIVFSHYGGEGGRGREELHHNRQLKQEKSNVRNASKNLNYGFQAMSSGFQVHILLRASLPPLFSQKSLISEESMATAGFG